MLAGLVAGLVACLFARFVGEPPLDGGIAYEDALHAASGEPPHPELVGRGVQSSLGLVVAYVVYGVALGGILALVHAVALGRLGRLGGRGTSVVVGLVGFVSAVAVPFLKYPANPPASTVGETIGQRTGLYVVMVVASVVLAACAAALARAVAATRGWWTGVLVAAGAYLAAVALVGGLLPAVEETPADFPAAVLYDFRVASLGGHLVLWTVVSLVFATLAERAVRPERVGATG
jgi:hypothetical protein